MFDNMKGMGGYQMFQLETILNCQSLESLQDEINDTQNTHKTKTMFIG